MALLDPRDFPVIGSFLEGACYLDYLNNINIPRIYHHPESFLAERCIKQVLRLLELTDLSDLDIEWVRSLDFHNYPLSDADEARLDTISGDLSDAFAAYFRHDYDDAAYYVGAFLAHHGFKKSLIEAICKDVLIIKVRDDKPEISRPNARWSL